MSPERIKSRDNHIKKIFVPTVDERYYNVNDRAFVSDILRLSKTDQQKESREKTETKKEIFVRSSLRSLTTTKKIYNQCQST